MIKRINLAKYPWFLELNMQSFRKKYEKGWNTLKTLITDDFPKCGPLRGRKAHLGGFTVYIYIYIYIYVYIYVYPKFKQIILSDLSQLISK